MPLSETQRRIVSEFRERVESAIPLDARFIGRQRADREDESTLATRWDAGHGIWYEVAVRPFLPQVRAGIVTDDRWKNEDFEQLIEDSGDTMQEFIELGFETAGLAWADPPVEHYRDHNRHYHFATPLDLKSLDQLAREETRERIRCMLEGYYCAFSGAATR